MRISKYHSCENSFLITMYENNIDYSLLAKNICDIDKYNADGLLVLKVDPIEVLIFNKDGSEALMCGNGLNCMMHYCYDKFKIYKYLKIQTKAGIFECEMLKKTPFTSCVNLGIAEYYKDIIQKDIFINQNKYNVTAVTLGVYHAVLIVDKFDGIENDVIDIFEHDLFSKEVNINFVKIVDKGVIEMITYERGVGWSRACGSGAGASVYVLNELYSLDNKVKVITPGGILNVEIDDNIYLFAESTFLLEMECVV